jgi:hypothetical protein
MVIAGMSPAMSSCRIVTSDAAGSIPTTSPTAV